MYIRCAIIASHRNDAYRAGDGPAPFLPRVKREGDSVTEQSGRNRGGDVPARGAHDVRDVRTGVVKGPDMFVELQTMN